MDNQPALTFYGAAGTVTGSKYLIEAYGKKILLDAGLFQGLKELRLRNWAKPPFAPEQIDAVVLSHAHIDHSGYLPILAREKFRGKIHCTAGTGDLLGIMLLDSAHLQEEEAAAANRHHYSKHKPALPLYTMQDAEAVLLQLERHSYGSVFEITPDIKVVFRRAGHILGAATVELQLGRKESVRLVFSGDLGRWNRPILRDPEFIPEADVLLVESTYGNRVHPQDSEDRLVSIIQEASKRKGAIIFPSFAVGRAQELLWTLKKLEDERKIPILTVYLDSPMAIDVTALYSRHGEELDSDLEKAIKNQKGPFSTRRFHLARTPEQSKAINEIAGPFVLISASGMATGGRILHHLKQRLPDPKTTVILPGFQAIGTRGRSLQDGAKTLKIYGEDIPVKATVELLDGLSAHADQNEILKWLSGFRKPPRQTYVVHGEPTAAEQLAAAIRVKLGWKAKVAVHQETVDL